MTGKNLLIAHSGGPTAVINASLAGVIRQARALPKINRVYAARHGIEGVLKEEYIDLTGLTEPELERLIITPGSAIGTCRYKLQDKDHERIVTALRNLGIGYFLYNGGNDSMDTCLQVARIAEDINVIGIPKTIDNDLAGTDHSPGYGSAARYYALSALEVAMDIQALNIHVCVMEIMGRNTGWLAASTALAHEISGIGPELIYFPERPFDQSTFLQDVQKTWDSKGGFLLTVSEGLSDERGEPLAAARQGPAVDGFGHALPGGVAQYLSELITHRLGIRCRSEKPGLLGRVSGPYVSEVDRLEAYEIGSFAVQSAADGESGLMVGIKRLSTLPYRCKFELIRLENVANVERKLPDEFITSSGNNVEAVFSTYSLPLIGGKFPDYYLLSQRSHP